MYWLTMHTFSETQIAESKVKRQDKISSQFQSQFQLQNLIYIFLYAYANIVHYNIISLIQDEDILLQRNKRQSAS